MFERNYGKKKIAVMLTGSLNKYDYEYARCTQSLQFLLEDWAVSYFAVLREEFAQPDVLTGLRAAIRGIEIIIVPAIETEIALRNLSALPIDSALLVMWHEIAYGAEKIPDLLQYEWVMRTRYDIFFHHQYLPELNGNDRDIWLPGQMSWSGSNDMICVGAPKEFLQYAQTFQRIKYIVAVEGIVVPEAVLARSLALAELREKRLEMRFIIYCAALHSQMSDNQLRILADRDPSLSAYKTGRPEDTTEARKNYIEMIRAITGRDALFPLHETEHAGFNFYPVEIDVRDGSGFRWLGLHGHLNRPLNQLAVGISFRINYFVVGWNLSSLTVLVEGIPVLLEISSMDSFGRLLVFGRFNHVPLRRPWSKIGFSSKHLVVPSSLDGSHEDHRALSVAISDFRVIELLAGELQRVADTVSKQPFGENDADEKIASSCDKGY
ncbi:hypothetical protein [Paraburkholderia hayleyella]|uniref:hypothetical protein n=1 Tax=Paraburkholderia hayleyella TaxID=2152889 RepID=UPI0012920CD0|nr:hypothetical protein [Paraburkholderia hayleyella]